MNRMLAVPARSFPPRLPFVDLIAVDGDPSQDIRALQRVVVWVMKGERVVEGLALRR